MATQNKPFRGLNLQFFIGRFLLLLKPWRAAAIGILAGVALTLVILQIGDRHRSECHQHRFQTTIAEVDFRSDCHE